MCRCSLYRLLLGNHVLPTGCEYSSRFIIRKVRGPRRLVGQRTIDDTCSNTGFKVVVGRRRRCRHNSVEHLHPFLPGYWIASI